MIILFVAVLSMGLATLLGRLLLGGILGLTFQRARDFVRRAIDRRRTERRHKPRGEEEAPQPNRRKRGRRDPAEPATPAIVPTAAVRPTLRPPNT